VTISESSEAVAATFVEPRGMIRSVVGDAAGRQLLGAVGGATASAMASRSVNGASPLKKGEIAHLSVADDEVTLCRAKRGAFRPKPTAEVIATAPREVVRSATLDKGRIAGVLTIGFEDGSSWAFDVPKVHLSGARQIAATLGSAI
jgi:hypothetical protein